MSKQDARTDRQARLAQQLRANLFKRKAQARAKNLQKQEYQQEEQNKAASERNEIDKKT